MHGECSIGAEGPAAGWYCLSVKHIWSISKSPSWVRHRTYFYSKCVRLLDRIRLRSTRVVDLGKRKTKEVLDKIFVPPKHLHPSWFGSDLACSYCNPYCYHNHQYGNPRNLDFCGDPNCPMNPKNYCTKRKTKCKDCSSKAK